MEQFSQKTGASKLVTAVFIILAFVVAGGGMWYYMDSKASNDKAYLQAQIDDLTNQVLELKAPVTTDSAPSTTVTTDEIADWKTYTNDTYGFSFKYPADLAKADASSYTENDGAYIYSNSSLEAHIISVEAEQSSLSLDNYITKALTEGVFSGAEKTSFAGQFAYEGNVQGLINYYGILVKNGEYMYHVSLDSGGEDTLVQNKANLTAIQNQILSSFQFTR